MEIQKDVIIEDKDVIVKDIRKVKSRKKIIKKDRFEEIRSNIKSITSEGGNDCKCIRISTVDNYRLPSFYILDNVTNNCQLGSIMSFNNLLYNQAVSIVNSKDSFDYILGYLCQKNMFTKRLLLVDIKKAYEKKLEKYIDGKNIISKSPYRSTNGSKMIIYLIKTSYYRKLKLNLKENKCVG